MRIVNWTKRLIKNLAQNWKNWLIKELVGGMFGVVIVGGVAMALCFFNYPDNGSVLFGSIGSIVVLICIGIVLSGFKSVPQEQRWIVEMFGAYSRTIGPGLCWVFPFLEKVRAKISVWTQKISLFERPIKIDFIDGSATPKDAAAFVRGNLFLPGDPDPHTIMPAPVVSPDPVTGIVLISIAPPNPSDTADEDAPRHMVYAVDDLKKAVVGLLENAVRSCLNGMSIDKALVEGRGGYNIVQKIPEDDLNGIREQLRVWGMRLERITIGDFDLDEAVIKARESVTIAGKAAIAAGSEMYRAITKSMGILLEAIGQLHGLVHIDDGTPEHKKLVGTVDIERVREWLKKPSNAHVRKWVLVQTQDLVKRNAALDKGALLDIRVPGGSGLEGIAATIAMILNRGSGGTGSSEDSPALVKPQKDVGDMTFEELAEAAKTKRKKKGKKEE